MSELYLNAEEEAFVLENEWDTVIPVSFIYTPKQGTVMSAFPQVEGEARAFLDRYGEDPTSDEALAFLFRALAPHMRRWGYADDRFRDRWGYILRAETAQPSVQGAALPRLLTADDEKINDTTYDLEATCAAGCTCYGIEEEGRIVSLAATHDMPEECEGVAEVGVETVPAARGKGYARACLSALTQDLTARGMVVEYRCQRYNEASLHVALGAGFAVTGRYYFYVGRKI